MDSDSELIQRARSGDNRAFEALVERHREMVYMLAYRMAGHREVALDISQEVWIKAYGALKRFRGEAAFKTWLYRVATNQAISHLRKLKRQGGVLPLPEDAPEQVTNPVGAVESNPAAEAGENPDPGLRKAVREAVDRLPPRQRAVFVLKFYRGLTHEEIAAVLGRTTGAIKSNYFQAMKKLAVYLKPYRESGG